MRACGLLQGDEGRLVPPVVPAGVVRHLGKLLGEEGVPDEALPSPPDWRILLMGEAQARAALAAAFADGPR